MLQCFENAQPAERVTVACDLSVRHEVDASPAVEFQQGDNYDLDSPAGVFNRTGPLGDPHPVIWALNMPGIGPIETVSAVVYC